MQGKLNKSGNLEILRGHVYRHQYCFMTTGDDFCGGWCPCFSEPFKEIIGSTLEHMTVINFCRGRLEFNIFIDERE